MTCIQCGSEIPDTATFCPYCGSSQKLEEDNLETDSSNDDGFADDEYGEQNNSEYAQQDNQMENECTYNRQIQSYLPLAIFSTLCCCIPIGIVAILYATKVPELAKCGRYEEAEECSKKALYWTIGAIAGGILMNAGSSLFSLLMQYFNGGF